MTSEARTRSVMTVAWKPSMAIPVVVAVTENATTSMRGERQGKPYRKHAKIARRRSAPADVRQRSSKKPFISSNRKE